MTRRATKRGPVIQLFALAIAMSRCGGDTSVTDLAPDVVKCQTSVSGLPSTVAASASRLTATITASRECAWSATSSAAWLRVSPQTGQGGGALTVAIAENGERNNRSGLITVNESRLTLTQDAAPPPEPDPPPEPNPTPTPTPNPSPTPGPDPTPTPPPAPKPDPTPPPHPTPPPAPDPPPPSPSPTCAIDLTPTHRSFKAEGGDGSARVKTQSGCEWRASSSAEWIVISSARAGTGNGELAYHVGRNTGSQDRSGSITVGGATHQIEQSAAKR